MTTVFSNVVGAIVQALEAGTPVSPNISRARIKPLAAEWQTAVVVRLQESQLDRMAIRGAPINTDTTVVVECYARSTSLSPDQAVDQLMQDAYARLAADPTLGGLVSDCQPQSINFDFDSEQDRMGCALITCLVRHRTQSLNLE